MKTILGVAVPILFAVFFAHTRLAAEDNQPTDMRLYPGEAITWKVGPAACLLAQRWLCSKAIQRKKVHS